MLLASNGILPINKLRRTLVPSAVQIFADRTFHSWCSHLFLGLPLTFIFVSWIKYLRFAASSIDGSACAGMRPKIIYYSIRCTHDSRVREHGYALILIFSLLVIFQFGLLLVTQIISAIHSTYKLMAFYFNHSEAVNELRTTLSKKYSVRDIECRLNGVAGKCRLLTSTHNSIGSSHSIISRYTVDIVVDEHVSIFLQCVSFQRRSLCATIECRTERKRMKSQWTQTVPFFVAIDSRSSVSNHSEIDWPALNIMCISCALCSAFTKNWLDDRLPHPNRCDRLSCAQARSLCCCFLSFLFFFLHFLRLIAFTLVKYSIYVLPGCFFFFIHIRLNASFMHRE